MAIKTFIQSIQPKVYHVSLNALSHVVAGFMVATAMFPFLNEEYKERFNYGLYILFPAEKLCCNFV